MKQIDIPMVDEYNRGIDDQIMAVVLWFTKRINQIIVSGCGSRATGSGVSSE